MNQLKNSVYAALGQYQESYEFQQNRKATKEVVEIKIVEDYYNYDLRKQRIAA